LSSDEKLRDMNPLARTLRTIVAETYVDFPSGPLSRRCFGAVFSADQIFPLDQKLDDRNRGVVPLPAAKPGELMRGATGAPITVFVSRKTGKLYVRRQFVPLFDELAEFFGRCAADEPTVDNNL
jgi:hypothetical protein